MPTYVLCSCDMVQTDLKHLEISVVDRSDQSPSSIRWEWMVILQSQAAAGLEKCIEMHKEVL